MLSDIEIAQAAKMQPITEIAANLGLQGEDVIPYGHYKAKLNHKLAKADKPEGKLILVTAISPTPAGEGKTTTSVGLADAMNALGKKTMLCLREPSLGPVFGIKGGAAGGGYAQVVPMEDINLHFTGDFHAITTAHNLLAAVIDNHIQQGNALDIDVRRTLLARIDEGWMPEVDDTGAAKLLLVTRALRLRRDRPELFARYAPLPVVFTRGEGVWLWDVEGRRYLDMMSAYSAVSFGHSHPRLVRALTEQASRLALTSRAYSNDRLPLMLERLSALLGYDRALPVNTGLEAVETAIKAARKWAYKLKGVADGQAEIIVCANNFHGRSTTIVGFSSEAQYRDGFGPFAPGFCSIPYGDAAALEAAITPNTAAFLFEPIQGEGGIVIPPAGWLARCAEVCRQHNVLLIADEVQTGLGRTGRLLACEHEGVRPDGVILGKALGGGLLPISAFLADERLMQVFRPGDHGSTFGGNPLASAVADEALRLLADERLAERAARLGEAFLARLQAIDNPLIREVRGRGLLIGMELDTRRVNARTAAEWLLARGLMTKDTHDSVLRFAPPLIVGEPELEWAAEVIEDALADLATRFPGTQA